MTHCLLPAGGLPAVRLGRGGHGAGIGVHPVRLRRSAGLLVCKGEGARDARQEHGRHRAGAVQIGRSACIQGAKVDGWMLKSC